MSLLAGGLAVFYVIEREHDCHVITYNGYFAFREYSAGEFPYTTN